MAELRYSLRGEVDMANANDVYADLQWTIAATDAHVLVDCTHLTFIDSSGVRVLLQTNDALEVQGRHMLIANLSPGPRKVFDVLGLSDLHRYDRTECLT